LVKVQDLPTDDEVISKISIAFEGKAQGGEKGSIQVICEYFEEEHNLAIIGTIGG